jgi:hypothetical protein
MPHSGGFSIAVLYALLCAPVNVLAITFIESTGSAGVSAGHTIDSPLYYVTGQAWGDYDNDGLEDLYLTDTFGPNTLYRNLGSGSFEVSDLNSQVSLPDAESGGATFVDYDNDGDQDLLVLNQGVDTLFENTGAAFTDVSTGSGLVQPGRGESAAWGDFNQDGYLDLYVVNWYFSGVPGNPLDQDRFYINNGNGTFAEVSHLLDTERMKGPGYAVTFVDYDNDDDLDIYVINDKLWGNLLFRNDGNGCGLWCFTDVSVATGADRPAWGMGIAVGDYDLDGDWDFFYSSIGEQVLLQNQIAQGSDSFLEVSIIAGVNADAVGWGTVFVDFDNDGLEDLYLSTSSPEAGRTNRVFKNNGDTTFLDVSESSGASNAGLTIGVVYADYDMNGLVDIVIGNQDEAYHLYQNTSTSGDWLSVSLYGRGPVNRDAVGTLAVLELSDGRILRRRVHIGSSIGSDHQRAMHFGLGNATPVELTLTWPDGMVEVIDSLPTNQTMTRQYPQPEMILQTGFE